MLPNFDRSLNKLIALWISCQQNQLLYKKLKIFRHISHVSIGICAVTLSFWQILQFGESLIICTICTLSVARSEARSEACSLGMQAAPGSIPTSGTFFHGDLVMKTFLRPLSFFRWFKSSSCQLLAKECALSTGKLPRRLAQEQCG